jgi:hypothetical protein
MKRTVAKAVPSTAHICFRAGAVGWYTGKNAGSSLVGPTYTGSLSLHTFLPPSRHTSSSRTHSSAAEILLSIGEIYVYIYIHICIYVYMYVCIYVYIYIYISVPFCRSLKREKKLEIYRFVKKDHVSSYPFREFFF